LPPETIDLKSKFLLSNFFAFLINFVWLNLSGFGLCFLLACRDYASEPCLNQAIPLFSKVVKWNCYCQEPFASFVVVQYATDFSRWFFTPLI